MIIESKEINTLDYSNGKKVTDDIIRRVEDEIVITEERHDITMGIVSLRGKLLNPDLVAKPMYDDIETFVENRSIVKSHFRYGLIDENNQVIIPLKYKELKRINDDLYGAIKTGVLRIFNRDGKIISEIKNKKISYFETLSDSKKETVIAIYGKQKYRGVINQNGNYLIRKIYDEIISLNDNLLMVKDLLGRWKVVDYHGNIKQTFNFKFAFNPDVLESGWIKIRYKTYTYLLNPNGELSQPFHYIGNFCNHLAPAQIKNSNDYCLITDEGNIIVDNLVSAPEYIGKVWHVQRKNKKYELYDKNGFIKDVDYDVDYGNDSDNDNENIHIIHKNELCGLVDSNGKIIVEPEYEGWHWRTNNCVLFVKDNSLVLINSAGKKIKTFYIGKQNVNGLDETKGFIFYHLDELTGVIDLNGKEVLPPMSIDSIYGVDNNHLIINNYLFNINTLKIQFKLYYSMGDKSQEFVFSSKKERDIFQLKCWNYMLENYTKQDKDKINKLKKGV